MKVDIGNINFSTKDMENLLSEIKESLTILNINDLDLKNNFEEDIQCIFKRLCKEFQVDSQIEVLFNTLFREF